MITFQQMIVLADQEGLVDYTPPALSRRTGIPLDIIEHGIKKLEEPDPYSRSLGEDGRRIQRLDEHRPWGWHIVNYDHYRQLASYADKREKARLRKRRQRERERQGADESGSVTQGHAESRSSRHTDTDTDTDKGNKVPYHAIVDQYHLLLPMLPKVRVLSSKRQAAMRSRWKTFQVEIKGKQVKFDNLDAWKRYFKFIAEKCPFLLGQNDRNWQADFDFCIRESAMVNVLESKYVNRK